MKFKCILKRILPITVNYKIRNFYKYIFQRKPKFNFDFTKKHVFFLDAPEYLNYGDQAIAFAMEKFMKENFSDFEQIEFQEDNFLYYINWIKKHISNEDIICLTGGGNMGTMYQKYEAIRRIIIQNFPNNKIIIFPQTITYDTNKYDEKELNRAINTYNKHKNLLIMAREIKSYNLMKSYFYNNEVILSPDIVLYLNYSSLCERKENVGICLRSDKESILSEIDKDNIYTEYCNYSKLSTVSNKSVRIDNYNREEEVISKLKEFADKSLIITDRLHGMIFAFITNTPCIALNNTNGKVKGVYYWIENKGKIKFLNKFEKVKFNDINNDLIDFSNTIKSISRFINK